jgi:hypothetical protein
MKNDQGKELLRVYDPMSLINLSHWDQEILHKSKIMYDRSWEREALQYAHVTKVCLKKKIHAGSSLPAGLKEDLVVLIVVHPSNRQGGVC